MGFLFSRMNMKRPDVRDILGLFSGEVRDGNPGNAKQKNDGAG